MDWTSKGPNNLDFVVGFRVFRASRRWTVICWKQEMYGVQKSDTQKCCEGWRTASLMIADCHALKAKLQRSESRAPVPQFSIETNRNKFHEDTSDLRQSLSACRKPFFGSSLSTYCTVTVPCENHWKLRLSSTYFPLRASFLPYVAFTAIHLLWWRKLTSS
jgi:hypothetical protein